MAKEEKKILTPEEKKREKEMLDKEKLEKAEIDKIRKEKERKRKVKEKKAKEDQQKEVKRIKTLVKLPFKLLLQVSLLVTMFSTIILFFWLELDLKSTMIYLFFIFTFFYFGLGSLMVAIFYMIGEDKKREMIEMQRIEAERLAVEEAKRQLEEASKLQELERDIAEMKNDSLKAQELLPEKGLENAIIEPPSSMDELEDQFSSPFMLGESAESLSNEFHNGIDDMNIDSIIESEMAKSAMKNEKDGNSDFNDMSYFDEIMAPDYTPNQNAKK